MVEWVEVARRGQNHHVLYVDLMTQTMALNEVGQTFGEAFVFIPEGFRQFEGARWFSKADVEKYTALMRKACEEGKVLEMGLAWERQADATRTFASRIRGNSFTQATNDELAAVFEEFCATAIRHWGHAYHYMMLNRFLPDEVAVQVSSHIKDPERKEELLRVLLTSDKPTEILRENQALVALADSLIEKVIPVDSPQAQALIESHLAKYAHLGRYYLRSQPYSPKDIAFRIRTLSRQDVGRKKEEFSRHQTIPEQSRRIIAELGIQGSLLAQNIYAVKQFAFAANYADESYGFLVECSAPMLKEIARRLGGIPWDELCSLQSKEILEFLRSGTYVSESFREALRQRFTDHAIVLEGGKITLLWGNELSAYRASQHKEEESHSHVRELKGLGASGGKARGKAIVVRTSADLSRVEKGNILVTTMTTPEFVPALERAAAVVTDEGGILCHASIVSRELHRPCVVGTRIATKAIRDGDEVDVDANAGVVLILRN